MAGVAGFDWPGYFRSLDDDEARALARWLAAESLGVGEFTEVVDRAYAAAPDQWQGQPRPFVAQFGRPAAQAYARRKRGFAGLAALEEALMSGALPGDVAPLELQTRASSYTRQRQADKLLSALERARRGQE
jgi:hypothetical protein